MLLRAKVAHYNVRADKRARRNGEQHDPALEARVIGVEPHLKSQTQSLPLLAAIIVVLPLPVRACIISGYTSVYTEVCVYT